MPSLLGAINGTELTSSHPSAPAPLIHESSPLTMPSSVSLKTTIRSKYSHCIVSLLLSPRAGFINAFQFGRHVPQGLKPASLLTLGGTAEAVPFQNKVKTRVFPQPLKPCPTQN